MLTVSGSINFDVPVRGSHLPQPAGLACLGPGAQAARPSRAEICTCMAETNP